MRKILALFLAAMMMLCCASAFAEGTFRVGMECNYAPYNWTQANASEYAVEIEGGGGYADGYDVQIARKIAEGLGKELVIVKTEWDGLPMGVMTGAFVLLRGASPANGMLPTPQTPVLAGYGNAAQTPEPAADAYDPAGQEGYTVTYGNGTTEGTAAQDGELPMDPTAQAIIVYAVTNNAQYYHKQEICDMQTNSRRMLLEDAIAEGLQPCSKCYPDGAPSLDAPQSVPTGGDVIIPDDALPAATDDAAG